MRIVLSSFRWTLEDALVARGETVLAIVPTAVLDQRRAQAGDRYQVIGLTAWGDSGELAQIANELATHDVASIDTTDEQCMRAAALLRTMLHVKGQTPLQALRATDKAVMKEVLDKADVPTARHRRIDSVSDIPAIASDLGWPVVVKPRRGFGTLGTRVISSHAELGELLNAGAFNGIDMPAGFHGSGLHLPLDAVPGGLLVEEFIDIDVEYHVEILRWHSEELYTLPARYVAPLLGSSLVGSVLLQAGNEHDQVAGLARAAADALELETGFAHVEVLKDRTGTLRIGEIGLRPGGGRVPQLLELHHGIRVPELAADLAVGQRPAVALSSRTDATAWVSAVAPQGRIAAITTTSDILALPHVINAETDLAPGQQAGGPLGSVALGTHVFTRATSSDEAEHAALAATRAWQITLAPSNSTPLAS